ncbi:TPA: lipid A modification system glycine--protein ligase AlmE [Vibrio cholerae]|nr:lipid A modification system glycine--protein ligase AlmE [Vibrio cholerae]HDZ9326140.1 lipid A modification system glycine--protein ligase AlmE [Vibrio cholerae]
MPYNSATDLLQREGYGVVHNQFINKMAMYCETRHSILAAIQANRHAPALWVKQKTYTYQEMTDIALSLSDYWHLQGVQRVAILSVRDLAAYSAIWASYLGGMTYIPLNARATTEQIQETLIATQCDSIMVDAQQLSRLSSLLETCFDRLHIYALPDVDIEPLRQQYPQHTFHTVQITEQDVELLVAKYHLDNEHEYAYIMQTSGSTGKPKRIAVSYSNLHSYISQIDKLFPLNAQDRVGQYSDLTFDLSVHDIFYSLISGACLYVVPELAKLSSAEFIRHHQLTVWLSVPTVIELALQRQTLTPHSLPSLRLSFFCGQALLHDLAEQWQQATQQSVINLYGPTECTIAITYHRFVAHSGMASVPIGRAFEEECLAIINEQGELMRFESAPEGYRGELLLSGKQLVNGYLNDPLNTQSAFFQHEGRIWYRSGDIVTKSNGVLIHLGRRDHQVKIAGQRVELEEIETVVRRVTQAHSVAIVPWPLSESGYASGTVAFVDTHTQWQPDLWLSQCKQQLNPTFVPKRWYAIEQLPRNANGKTDIKALQQQLASQTYETSH